MSTSSDLPVQDELLLIERVFLRIGSAATDEALEAELNKFLPPIILKLTSPAEAVRKKVMELLIHINRRVKDLKHIQLPVDVLLTQYQDPSATSFVTNFSIIYIKMGYPRLDVNKRVELLPTIINCLEGKPVQHQESLLHLMMPVFNHLKIPETPEKTASLFNLRERTNVAKLLVDFMLDVVLLPYGATTLAQQGSHEYREDSDGPPVPGVPAGMSITSFKRVCGEVLWKPEELENIKVAIVKFLSSEVLPSSWVAPTLIVASSDTRFSVANAAEMSLRRLDSTFEFNNTGSVAAIYVLFLGTLTPKERTPVERFKNPANTRIRLKLMPFLLRSKEATNYAPLALKVFYECMWGASSNSKLKQQGVTFLHHMAFTATREKLAPVGGVLFSGVVKVIEEERGEARLRSLAYGALAKLSLKLPALLLAHSSQLHYLQTLMDALVKEEGDVLLAVQEALSMVAPVCKQLTPTSQDQLCVLLSEHVLHPNPQLRRTAIHYAASVFAHDHVASRFILMIATGDSQDDIRLEARRQLYKCAHEDKDGAQHFQTPPFTAMVAYVIERANALPKAKWLDVANQPVPFSVPVMDQILLYLEHCISVEAYEKKRAEEQLFWEESPRIGKFLAKIIEQHRRESKASPGKAEPNPLDRYIGFAELAANAWSGVALECILRVVAVVPRQMSGKYSSRMDWIKKYIMRGGYYGEVAAHLYGVVAGHFKEDQPFEKALHPILKIKDLRVESQESCILAQGHMFCYKLDSMKKDNQSSLKNWLIYETVVRNLITLLLNDSKILQLCIVTALGEIARKAPLPIPVEGGDGEISFKSLLATLTAIYTNKKLSSKIREQAIITSGYLCVGEHDFSLKVDVIHGLLGLAKETNELEIHFAVGEALADCVLGQDSPSSRNAWVEEEGATEMHCCDHSKDEVTNDEVSELEEKEKDSIEMMEKDQKELKEDGGEPMETDEDIQGEPRSEASSREAAVKGSLEWLLQELLVNYVPQTHPHCRQASCIWLLAVLKRCRKKSAIQKYLAHIQSAFMDLLGESNDLIQDAASKGLGVVYECCSEATRQSMVEGLVRTLTEGKRSVKNITTETQIFQEGELGKAPSGGQLSTYKELCSLATDLNQPELIYKFMNLANHNAIWNSKKGAAFGFSTLASQAGAQLEPYLPQIIPKLYRYQHDPTPRIQQPMAAIWNSLVSDNSSTIAKYYEPILMDILSNLTHPTWRVRESCCNALTDLLRRQSASEAGHHVAEMWQTLFRVRDDIKESVRFASDKTLNTLSKSCIKVCDSPNQESRKMLEEVLPVLLTAGLSSSVAEVRTVSIQTLVKLCRSGGSMVRPHLGTLVPSLLEALSGLEHQAVNYTAVRIDDEGREKLDSARVAAAKSTPIMDTLNHVLQFVDEEVIESVVVGVIDVLKRSVGLVSRAGAAHVVVTLTHTCPGPLEKYTGKILAALVNGLGDRNPVVRKVFANAIGSLVRTAKATSVERLLAKLQSWYLEREAEGARVSAALALRSMHSQNGDAMRDHAAAAMPLAFLAMHAVPDADPGGDPTGVELWEEIWTENTPGTAAGVRLYLNEIIAVCELALQSTNWMTKAQAGRALSTVSEKLGPTLTEEQVRRLIYLLTQRLQGRTWAGKEAMVAALCNVALHTKVLMTFLKDDETNEPLLNLVVSVLTREAKKEKIEYKIHAIKALTQVLNGYSIDRFEEVFHICLPYLSVEKERSEDVDADSHRSSKEESLQWDLVDEMVHSLGRAWPVTRDTQEKFSEQVVEMLSTSVTRVPRKTQLSIVGALREFWARHFMLEGLPDTLDHVLLGGLLHYTCKIFNYCLGVAKFYSLRREALVVLNEFMEKAKGSFALVSRVRADLLSSVEEAKRDAQPDVQALATAAHRALIGG